MNFLAVEREINQISSRNRVKFCLNFFPRKNKYFPLNFNKKLRRRIQIMINKIFSIRFLINSFVTSLHGFTRRDFYFKMTLFKEIFSVGCGIAFRWKHLQNRRWHIFADVYLRIYIDGYYICRRKINFFNFLSFN